MSTSVIRVVVPAHDEAELVGACLVSIQRAMARLPDTHALGVGVVLVLDRCSDATLEVATDAWARGGQLTVLPVDAGCVGRARDLGVRHVLDHLAPDDADPWVAMTDADSTVSADWLSRQLEARRGGSDLWVGAVRPDPTGLTEAALREWEERHAVDDHLRVYGANLGFSGSLYRRAGGFPAVSEHEDVAFVRAALATGCTWTTGPATVQTSARTDGRTPGGFAGYIRDLLAG